MEEIDLKWKFVEQSLNLLQEQVDKVNTAARAAQVEAMGCRRRSNHTLCGRGGLTGGISLSSERSI